MGSARPTRTRSTYPLSTLRGLSIRLRAKEPKAAKPHAKQLGNVDLRQNAADRIAFLAKRAREPGPGGYCVDVESILGREAPLNVRGDSALHREFQRVRRRKHLPIRERNDCEANLEPGVTVARAIERVESFPDVSVDGRSKHRGRQSIEIGARQMTEVVFLIRLQSIQHNL